MKHLLFIAVAFIILSCTKPNKQTINVAGSTTVLPVVSVASEKYMELNPTIRIIVNEGGSGVGVNQVGSQQVEIGMISRDITQKEIEQYP